jgi:excisionase family DNA binding protein
MSVLATSAVRADSSSAKPVTPIDESWRFHTVGETAQILRVSVNTVRNWAKAGRLKTSLVGRRRLVPAASIAELLRG